MRGDHHSKRPFMTGIRHLTKRNPRIRTAAAVLPFLSFLVAAMSVSDSAPSSADARRLTTTVASYKPTPAASVSWLPMVDSVTAGNVYIRQLPDSIDGVPVSTYTATRLPLRSWLLDKSFFWATEEVDRGEHTLDLRAIPISERDSVDSFPFPLHVVVR